MSATDHHRGERPTPVHAHRDRRRRGRHRRDQRLRPARPTPSSRSPATHRRGHHRPTATDADATDDGDLLHGHRHRRLTAATSTSAATDGIVRVDGSGEMDYEAAPELRRPSPRPPTTARPPPTPFTIALTTTTRRRHLTYRRPTPTANAVAEDVANGADRRDHRRRQRRRRDHEHRDLHGALTVARGRAPDHADTSGVVTVADTSALDREAGDSAP